MVAGNKSIVDYITGCASGSPSDQELAQLAGAIEGIENGDVGYSVSCIDLLPDAAENTGRFVFVQNIGAYRVSNGVEWTNNYDSALNISTPIFLAGCNAAGKLGNSSTTNTSSPVQEFSSSTNWSFVAASGATFMIDCVGHLYGVGQNANGPLGTNDSLCYSSPVREYTSSEWCVVSGSGSGDGRLAIKTDGTMWNAGSNGLTGVLGISVQVGAYSSPVQEISSSTWTLVCGNGYSYTAHAIKTDGSLWGWGCNNLGYIGSNSTANVSSPIQEITLSTNWCYIGAGRAVHGIKTDGTLWGWGNSIFSGVGDGTITCRSSPVREFTSSTNWTQVSSGRSSSVAIKTDGTLWVWGGNLSGVLGINSCVSSRSPIQEITSSTNWCFISMRQISAAAIKTDGSLWAWGANYGNLADGTTINRSSPVQEYTNSKWCYVSMDNHLAGIKNATTGFNEP